MKAEDPKVRGSVMDRKGKRWLDSKEDQVAKIRNVSEKWSDIKKNYLKLSFETSSIIFKLASRSSKILKSLTDIQPVFFFIQDILYSKVYLISC